GAPGVRGHRAAVQRWVEAGLEQVVVVPVRAQLDLEALAALRPPVAGARHGPQAELPVTQEVPRLLRIAEVDLSTLVRLEVRVQQAHPLLVVFRTAPAEGLRGVLELFAHAGRRLVRRAVGQTADRPDLEAGQGGAEPGVAADRAGQGPVHIALDPARSGDAHAREGEAAGPAGHRHAQVLDEAPRPLGRAVHRDAVGGAQRDAVQGEGRPRAQRVPHEVGRRAVEGDDVAEVRSVVRLERAVAVQVLRVDAAVAAGAVRALVADRVRGLVGRRLASLVPEAARVVLP